MGDAAVELVEKLLTLRDLCTLQHTAWLTPPSGPAELGFLGSVLSSFKRIFAVSIHIRNGMPLNELLTGKPR